MAATVATMNDALMRVYHKEQLVKQFYAEDPLLDRIRSQTRHEVGETCRVVLQTSRNGGTSFVPDAGSDNLTPAGSQGLNKAEYNYTNGYQQVSFQETVLAKTASNAQSVAQALSVEVDGAVSDLRKQLTRCLFLNGDALIATCGTTSGSTTVNLAAASGHTALERGWIFPGSVIDIGTTTDEDVIADGVTVTSVSDSATTPQITISGSAVTTSASHFVSLANARQGTTSYEPNGLRNIVSTSTTLGGLAASAPWVAAAQDTTTTTLTISKLLDSQRAVRQRTGNQPSFLLTGLLQEQRLYEVLQQQVRYISEKDLGTGSVSKPTWNGSEIMAHQDCPDTDLYFGRMENLFIVASKEPHWQNEYTGTPKILEWIPNSTRFGAVLMYHFNVATDFRQAFSKFNALT